MGNSKVSLFKLFGESLGASVASTSHDSDGDILFFHTNRPLKKVRYGGRGGKPVSPNATKPYPLPSEDKG